MEQALGAFFYDKVLPAANAIKQGQAIFGDIVLSYNGGKDCTVLLEIIEYFGIDIPVVVFHEPDTFPELLHFTKERLQKSFLRKCFLSSDIQKEMSYLVSCGVKGVVLGERIDDPAHPNSYFQMSTPG